MIDDNRMDVGTLSRMLRTLLILPGIVFCGCRLFESAEPPPSNASVLRPAQASPDSVTIEVFLVRVPETRLAKLDEVWLHADEQVLDAQVRRELSRNGFRAGVIGPSPPPGLADLLQLDASAVVPDNLWQSVSLDKQAMITGHRKPMRPNKRLEIQLEPVHDVAPLFIATDAGLAGDDYELAQGQYAIQWTPLRQGRIRLEITPELDYGTPRNQYTVGEGYDIHRHVARNRKVFEQLRMHAPLSAGQMLIISGDGNGSGSLGHFYHSVPTSNGSEHRIILVRLAQVPGAT